MATRLVDILRDSTTGNGVPSRSVSVRKVSDNSEIATATTDANGKFSLTVAQVGYEGPIYYSVSDGAGVTKKHSGQSFGQVGPVWFDAIIKVLSGLGKGVMSGLEVTADGSGMTVDVSAGTAIAKDGIPYYWESTQEVAITAADGSNPRIDLIVLRVDRLGQAAQGAFELVAIAGTPAASPSAPSAVANSANDDIVLAEVLVDTSVSVIASNKVTDRRTISGQEIVSIPFNGAGIDDETVDTTQLSNGAVTSAKIEDAAVTNAKVATGIDAAKIADGSVSNTEFQYIGTVSSNVQDQLDDKVDTSTYTSGLAGKSDTTHTHTQVATLAGEAFNAHTNVKTVNTSSVDICNFNLGPLVSGVTYDVVAMGDGQANAASGGTITGQIRIESSGSVVSGYGTATVGGERQIGAATSKSVVGAGATINISFRAISTNPGASVNGARVSAFAIPRDVPAS